MTEWTERVEELLDMGLTTTQICARITTPRGTGAHPRTIARHLIAEGRPDLATAFYREEARITWPARAERTNQARKDARAALGRRRGGRRARATAPTIKRRAPANG